MTPRGKNTAEKLCWSVVVVMMLLTSGVEATITLAKNGNITFDSMPATFGMTWVSNVEYRAHLLYLPNDPFLCKQQDGTSVESIIGAAEDDDLPIAVLASRGGCSFEEKARVAMNMKNVSFVIVYDDRKRTRLVPMSSHSDSTADVSVGMLFVSESTGYQLTQLLMRQAADDDIDIAGMTISMDAVAPPQPPENPSDDWIAAVTSSVLAVVAIVALSGCMGLCFRAGFVHDTAQIAMNRRSVFKLLTHDQVLELPTVEYHGSSSSSSHDDVCCAICIEEFVQGDTLRQLPCEHEFHTECIIPWLTERHPSCPLCKHSVVPPEEEDNEEEEEEDSTTRGNIGGGDVVVDGTNHILTVWQSVGTFLAYYRRGRTLVASEEDEPGIAMQVSQSVEDPEVFSDEHANESSKQA